MESSFFRSNEEGEETLLPSPNEKPNTNGGNTMKPQSEDRGEMAEIPRPVTSKPSSGRARLRKSRFIGVLIYILQKRKTEFKGRVSINQALWIQDLVARQSLTVLEQASSYARIINTSPRVRSSLNGEINRILRVDRTPSPITLAEKRRIGVGYKDKGTLRPPHIYREEVSEVFHREDVEFLLPLDHDPLEEWITAEEVLSQLSDRAQGQRALLQVQAMFGHDLGPTLR
jgi:hypothetical protein